MIIRYGYCDRYGKGRKNCHWLKSVNFAYTYYKNNCKGLPIYIKIGKMPYKQITEKELENISNDYKNGYCPLISKTESWS